MRVLTKFIAFISGFALMVGAALAQNSGYLTADLYGKLADATSPSGEKVKRWIAPGVKASDYDAVLLEPAVFYPLPQGSEQVSTETLQQITAYLDEALRRELAGIVKLTAETGPKTLRFRPAITAAATKKLALKPYQYVPLAFIATGGSGGKGATLALEYNAVDSDTSNVVAAGMRESVGPKLKSAKQVLSIDDFKPLIDVWAKDMAAMFTAGSTPK